jgi:hypothetical protein
MNVKCPISACTPLMLWVRIPVMSMCTQYNIIWSSLSVTCGRSVVFSWYSGFFYQTKEYNIGICCFSVKNVALRRKNKDCGTRDVSFIQSKTKPWELTNTRQMMPYLVSRAYHLHYWTGKQNYLCYILWFDRDSNPRSTTLEASKLTIAPTMWFG